MLEHVRPERIRTSDRLHSRLGPNGLSRSLMTKPFTFSILPGTTVFGDVLVVWLCSMASGMAYQEWIGNGSFDAAQSSGFGIIVGLLMVIWLNWREMYRPARITALPEQAREIVKLWFLIFLMLSSVAFMLKVGDVFSRGEVGLFFISGVSGLIGWRIFIAYICRQLVIRGAATGPRVAILAENGRGDIADRTDMLRKSGYDISQCFVVESSEKPAELGQAMQGGVKALIDHIRKSHVDEVIVLVKWANVRFIQATLNALDAIPLPIKLLPEPEMARYIRLSICDVGHSRALLLKKAPLSGSQLAAKRCFDLVVASIILILLSPLMVVVALAVAMESEGPIIFRQKRGGYNGRSFDVYKFRTMGVRENGAEVRQAQRNDPRVTKIGRTLRKLSIDELPQIFNVLKGDMSLVGPRPHAAAHDLTYAKLIAPYLTRYNVKPGITGWAQVNDCRGETARVEDMERRVEFDIAYIENWSLWFDLQILIRTSREVFRSTAY